MTLSQYLLGAAELAVIAAALGLGAFHMRAAIVPGWSGAPARLAEFVIGISALVVISELLGVLGLFEDAPLVLACAAAGLGGAYWARGRVDPGRRRDPAPRASTAMLAIAIAASALVVAHWAVPTQQSLDTGMYYQDTTWYHMSFSGRFAQDATVGPLHFTDPLKLTAWFYPQNSELLHAVGIVALDSDFLSPLINLGWLCLALAAWCIGRPYGVGAATVLGAAVVLDSDMIVGSQAGNAPNDVAGLFFLLAMLAFLITGAANGRAARSGRAGAAPERLAGIGTGPLFLAALAAGLGIGTKITLLAAIGVLSIGIVVLGGRDGWLRAAIVWFGGMLITAGFWYGRNLVYAANPFPQVGKLGPINLPGPDQAPVIYPRDPHKLSEYYNDPTVWKHYLFPVLHDRLGPLWPVILAVVVVGLIMLLLRGDSWLKRLLALTGLVAGIAYVFTPLTASGQLGQPTGFDANLRYVAPVLIFGFVLLPLVPTLRRSPWSWAVLGFLAVLLLQVDVTSSKWDQGHLAGAILLAAILVGVPVAIAVLARRGAPAAALVALPVAAVALLVGLGNSQRVQYLRDRYASAVAPPLEGGFRSTPAWFPLQEWGKHQHDARIAVVGRGAAFGQYVFYGDDLSNYVQYIGKQLNRGTYRPILSSCKDWRRAINAGNYDFVVTTPRFNESEDKQPKENRWTTSPATKVILSSGPARIFKINGELDVSACGHLGKAEPRS
jgi:hypothetical protein